LDDQRSAPTPQVHSRSRSPLALESGIGATLIEGQGATAHRNVCLAIPAGGCGIARPRPPLFRLSRGAGLSRSAGELCTMTPRMQPVNEAGRRPAMAWYTRPADAADAGA